MVQHSDFEDPDTREVIVVGGGIAGLSAAIYLGRAQRDTLVIDSGHSMAKWEPVVQNYLGFPQGVGGEELLKNGRDPGRGAMRLALLATKSKAVSSQKSVFVLKREKENLSDETSAPRDRNFSSSARDPRRESSASATACFSAKTAMAIGFGENGSRSWERTTKPSNTRSACSHYSACVIVVTNGKRPLWDKQHARWLEEYEIPVARKPVRDVEHRKRKIRALEFTERGKE